MFLERSQVPRVVVIALDCLQKLIAYGHISGTSPDPHDPRHAVCLDGEAEGPKRIAKCDAFTNE